MCNTLVTVEPTTVAATLVDGRVSMAADTTAGRVHLQRGSGASAEGDDASVTLVITDRAADLDVTVVFAPVDVAALAEGFAALTRGDADAE